jgi:putative transcriptional regulator
MTTSEDKMITEEQQIKVVSDNLKHLRRAAGLTQEDLAQRVGVTRQTIVGIENNKMVPSKTLVIAIIGLFVVIIAGSPIVAAVAKAVGLDRLIEVLFKIDTKQREEGGSKQ